ncbi:regulatory protein RecX [Marinicella litoralis]|uniref:Regulatory protein RecX n=1 Tax=Marinicella litoralis TaxID=644220 RepID=A0A4R6XGJ7_9GAMM|nr:regulatory protein RecX [Marinicella litoralis]TDR18525.1 regulatory protein [Marinicella litoralis]
MTEVKRYSPEAKARASALGSLAMREHSAVELRQKLINKKHDAEIVEKLIIELIEENLLSDERFAESYWRVRSSKGYGATRINKELQMKGVPDRLIQTTKLVANVDFFALIESVYEKKYKSMPIQDYKERAKRQAFLYRRGFDTDLIKTVIN